MTLTSTLALRPKLTRSAIIALSAAWIATLPNLAALREFATAPAATTGAGVIPFVAGGWIAIFTVTVLLLQVLGLLFWGKGIRYLCATVTVAASALGYYSLALSMRFDRGMFASLVQTDVAEARDLITPRLLIWIILVGIIPAIMMLRTIIIKKSFKSTSASMIGITLCSLAMLLAVILPQYQRYASAGRTKVISFHTVAPANFISAAASYWLEMKRVSLVRLPLGLDAKTSYFLAKPRLVVFVLGETARAVNHSLNGYGRLTNPRLQDEDIAYFPDTMACGTVTAISVPCMFSGLKQADFSLLKALSRQTLLNVALHANVQVLWRDNDGGCKGVCLDAKYEDLTNSTHPMLCPESGNCHDEILLEGLEAKLKSLKSDTLVVLHLKGSHGPAYFKRYPAAFEHFKPACKSTEFSQCTTPEIVNAYDNTIRYTDHVIAETISILKRLENSHAPALLYASDHGESLGEKGMYLHGLPYAIAPAEQTKVPMLTWLSQSFLKHERWKSNCRALIGGRPLSHDYIFHSILALLDIDTHERNPNLDLYGPCDEDDDNDRSRRK